VRNQRIYIDKPKLQLFTDNIVSGLGWGMGTILGALVLFTVLGLIASKVQAIPYIGEFVYGIIIEVQKLQGK
jgi:MFS-type transporter involved in bile tolerance (Atg22 family)